MARSIIVIFLSLCLSQGILGQMLHYDAYKKDSRVGEMDVSVSEMGSRQTFEVQSSMDFRFLVSLKVRFQNTEIFQSGILQSGSVSNRMIGFKDSNAKIERQMNGYHLVINDDPTPVEDSEITYTVAKIYTQQPYHGQKVYSPYYGEYFTFQKVGTAKYKYSGPDGDNYYTYHEGVCTEAVMERDFATITFKLKPEVLAAVKSNAANFRSND